MDQRFLRVFIRRLAATTVPGSNRMRPDQIHTRAAKRTN